MRIRLLRGQVVIREEHPAPSALVWTPAPSNPREVKTHRGRVLAMGPPALTRKGAEVPHGFRVGDTVQFHFVHLEKAFTREWIDGEIAVWVPQECVDAVIE